MGQLSDVYRDPNPKSEVELAEMLEFLRRCFVGFLQNGVVGSRSFEELYSTSFYLSLNRWSAQLYDLVTQVITQRAKEIRQMVARLTPGDMLDSVVVACETFSFNVMLIEECVVCMRRTFVQTEGLAEVSDLGKRIFDEEVPKQIAELRILESWRRRVITQMLAEAPMSDEIKETANMMLRMYAFAPTPYETDFEMPLRIAAVNFYHGKAVKFLDENGTEGFDDVATEWLRLESDRASMCILEQDRNDYLSAIYDLLSLSDETFQCPAL